MLNVDVKMFWVPFTISVAGPKLLRGEHLWSKWKGHAISAIHLSDVPELFIVAAAPAFFTPRGDKRLSLAWRQPSLHCLISPILLPSSQRIRAVIPRCIQVAE
jgi:hypothetical protein